MQNKLRNPDLILHKCYIGGKWVVADSGETMEIVNPADGAVLGSVPKMGAEETIRAIDAANKALPAWKIKTAKERAVILRRWFDLIMANQNDLAIIMTLEQGKPLAESRGEIAYAASFVEWFAEEGKRIYGDIIPPHIHNRRIIVTKEPIGVTAAITPWNFPSAMITRKVAPALAAGCTSVIKPASQTPYSALALVKLAEEAGVPSGVLNIVVGKTEEIGNELTSNPIVRKLSFTGSTGVGKKLIEKCAATVKKVSMELGGNAPFIVFDDADIDQAVKGAMISKYRNSGQTCICANRIFVQEKVYDEFIEKFVTEVRKLKVGNGLEEGVEQGPMIDAKAIKKVKVLIDDAITKGAKVLIGGKPIKGNFFEPTVIGNAMCNMLFFREEIFGPVAPVFKFSTEEEVIALANDTEYGLASYFYTRDVARVWRVFEQLEYGMVAVNDGILSTEIAPFGGVKESGIGREGSRYGIDEYLEMKYVCLNLYQSSQ